MRTTRLRVVLLDVVPTVVRVIDVPAAIRLDELHNVLQVALGWTDSHLHQFRTDTATYASADADFDDDDDDDEFDERGARLTDLPARFGYAYDFGDGWQHEVEVLGPGGELPGCLTGEGACPPEDCGGPHGYADLLAALADPRHPEHRHLRKWVGDRLRPFDREATERQVRAMVGEVPASVGLLLGLLAGGVKLTPGGRLPRAVVRAVQAQRPDWYPLDRPAAIEDDLPPLAALHDMLRHVGLARLAKGVLRPTKAAGERTRGGAEIAIVVRGGGVRRRRCRASRRRGRYPRPAADRDAGRRSVPMARRRLAAWRAPDHRARRPARAESDVDPTSGTGPRRGEQVSVVTRPVRPLTAAGGNACSLV